MPPRRRVPPRSPARPRRARGRLLAFGALALAAGSVVGVACSESRNSPAPAPPPAQPMVSAPVVRSPDADAGADGAAMASAEGGYAGPFIGAIVVNAPIWSEMDVPDRHPEREHDRESRSIHLGYLRYGEKAPVLPEPHANKSCPEGWYQMAAGGFVCGKTTTLDMDHPKFKQAKAPDLDAALPYTYGINVVDGTPLYRQLPSREQRLKYEPWLNAKPKKAKTSKSDDENPYVPAPDGGAVDPPAIREDAGDAGADATPWWEQRLPDGGPPPVALDDIKKAEGPLAGRMAKGFYASLDQEIDAGGTRWWRTMTGVLTPADRIMIAKPPTEFHGVWLGKDDATFATTNAKPRRIDALPVAFVLHRVKRFSLDETHKHATVADGLLDRFDAVGLTGDKARVEGVEYWEMDDKTWVPAANCTKTEPGPPPAGLGEHEKWVDVNLKKQMLVAFEGTTPVFVTLISSGRNEHETPPGTFRIREKHIAATMDADTASDGPYSIEDVPYIEYFNAGYALHGAFWHAVFGYVKSHGCVNLAPWDARALFGWTEPQLPEGWHAIVATKDRPGTRVIVHERAPGTCEGPAAEPPQCPTAP